MANIIFLIDKQIKKMARYVMLNYAIYFFSSLRLRTTPRQLGSRKSSQGVIRYPRGVRSFTGITPTRAGGVHEPGSTKPNHQP